MGHITIEEFKDLPLGLKDSIYQRIGDTGLQTFIDTASQQVDNFCGRQLSQGTVAQDIFGTGANLMLLREYPVASLTTVTWEDDLGLTGSEDVADLRVTEAGVVKFKNPLNGPFLPERLYTVTYVAGYDPVPGPIKHATALWVTELLQPTFNQGQQGKPLALVELSSEQIGELLEEYRRKGAR